MPSPEFNPEDAFSGYTPASPDGDEEHSELKALVDAIAAQLSDATRRHSETLGEMQDRIAEMGREAEALRDHIPQQYAPTFEHIEAGVAELAKRLAKANASDASSEETNPWDHANAEALTHVYESEPRRSTEASPLAFPAFARGAESRLDQAWFEARFADIARGIEESLAEIRPDRGFHQIGERLDRFEQRFGGMLGAVATRADLDAIRLIEEHVGEVVNHMVQTQDQLARLSAIEEQLAAITQTLSGEHESARSGLQSAAEVLPASGIDVDAIARAAAEQAAMRFAELAPAQNDAAGDLRPLIERMMEEHRNGGENTAALLDTMQQAMIRLLDRVDEIEIAQRREMSPHAASLHDFPEAHGQPEDPFQTQSGDSDPLDLSDDISAPFLSETVPPELPHAASFERQNPVDAGVREKMRQDFVAEARRAKMRLSSASDDDIVVTSAPHSDSFAMSSADASGGSRGSRPIRPVAARAKASGPSGPSPRLIVLAIAAILALGGLWYTVGTDAPAPGVASSSSSSPAAGTADDQSGSSVNGSPNQNGTGAGQSPNAGARGDQQGQATPAAPGGNKSNVSMLGVAVDLDSPVTAASIQQAQRHQAMAALSGRLGDAAAQGRDASLVPASMVPSEAETEGARAPANASVPGDATGAMRFELPSATVGPLSLRLAAANGDASAEFEVGARLAEGKGTPQDFKEAAKWYRRAADQGFVPAQYRLGTFYERGLGMKADRAQAEMWYKLAANKGNIKAMHNLAVLSANQTGQSPDYTTAAQWFEEAAKRGLADSQFNLAILYENGLGVGKNMKQAYMWFSLAAQDKDSDAVRRQGILRAKLTSKDLAEAERMIREWRPLSVDRTVNDARLAGEEWKKNPTKSVAG